MSVRKKAIGLAACAVLCAGTVWAAANDPSELDADTVEYDMNTGVITAVGNVLMKNGTARLAGDNAVYNSQTKEGSVTGHVVGVKEDLRMTADQAVMRDEEHITASGNVVADKGDLHMTSDIFRYDGKDHFIAEGNVHGRKADKTFAGPIADYRQDTNYVVIQNGGTITSPDGVFTADHMQGWLTEEHYRGTGNAHLVSPPKKFEGGGDTADYYGKENKAILVGHAWAIQDNNMLRSNHLTVYLTDDGKPQVQPSQQQRPLPRPQLQQRPQNPASSALEEASKRVEQSTTQGNDA